MHEARPVRRAIAREVDHTLGGRRRGRVLRELPRREARVRAARERLAIPHDALAADEVLAEARVQALELLGAAPERHLSIERAPAPRGRPAQVHPEHATGAGELSKRGTRDDDTHAFVVEDGRYLSGRWPGDAYLIAKRLIARLARVAGGGAGVSRSGA